MKAAGMNSREYFGTYYKGNKSGQEYKDLWNFALSTDLTLEQYYQAHGYNGVVWALNMDDRLEHWLSRLGGQVEFVRTGDRSMLDKIQTAVAPGDASLLPEWSVEHAHNIDKAEYQAWLRHKNRGGGGGNNDDAGGGGGKRRRPQRRGQNAQGGGGGGTTQSPKTPPLKRG